MRQTCSINYAFAHDYTLMRVPSELLVFISISKRLDCYTSAINKKGSLTQSAKSKLQKISSITLTFFLLQVFNLHGNEIVFNKNGYNLVIPKIDSAIEIDGSLNELAWDSAGIENIFWLHYPVDSGKTYAKTEVKMMYDEKNLYIGFTSYEFLGRPVVQSLKRDDDVNTSNSDGITIVIDPANTAKSGYYFRVNAAGAEIDGTVSQNGMYPSVNNNWNNKWFAKVRRNQNTVYYEIAIPFSAIKYNNENSVWGINFIRNDVNRNVTYTWTWFPANKNNLDLGYTGNLIFKDGLSKSKFNKMILIPSISGRLKRNTENNEKTNYNVKGGLDAKVSVSSSLNLDLSVYPDFSNVAVDKQYIDFYRFEYYQPEQRCFFLENNDLFSNFGTYDDNTTSASESRVKPIYTRRIGINNGENIPIIYGARLSGEIADNTRIGLLNLQTESFNSLNPQNYLVGSIQKGVFNRSAIKGFFTSRNSTNGFNYQKNDFNRTGGIEFDYSTEDGKWSANAKFHTSFTPEQYSDNLFYGGGFTFYNKKVKTQNWVEHVDKNYITDIGFVPRLYYKDTQLDTVYRNGYTHFTNKYELFHFINNNWIIVMGEYTNINTYLNEKNKVNEFSFDLGYWSVFSDNTHIVLQTTYKRFDLLILHDVLDNDKPVPTGTYKNSSLFFLYESDPRKKFKFNTSIDYGQFLSGEKLTFTSGPSYNFQPYATVSLTYNLTDINLKNGYGQATYHLIGLQPEISFSTKLLWTNLIQYNTQLNNINFNSILQWRFAPMSDFYIVLKDDASRSGTNKKFELSFKLTYWFGI